MRTLVLLTLLSAACFPISNPTDAEAPGTDVAANADTAIPTADSFSDAPSEDTPAPSEDTPAPSEDTSAPSEDTSAPSEDTSAPSEDTSAPSEDTSAPSEDTSAPSEDTSTPSADTSAPSEDTSAPSEDTSAPSEDTSAEDVVQEPSRECLDLLNSGRNVAVFGETPVTELWDGISVGNQPSPFRLVRDYAGRGSGDVVTTSDIDGNPFSPPAGTYPIASAFFIAPQTSAFANSVICFDDGVVEVSTSGISRARTTSGTIVGSCAAGTPVLGKITFCLDGGRNECAQTVGGEIDGVPIATTLVDHGTNLYAYPDSSFRYQTTDLKTVKVYVDNELGAASVDNGAVSAAFIITEPNGPFGGAVFCAGATSTYVYRVNGYRTSVTLRDLRRLGSCTGDGGTEVVVCL